MLKFCSGCNRELPIEKFSLRKITLKDSFKYVPLNVCRECNNRKSREHYLSIKNKRIYYIYRFLGSNGEVLYVGKTESLRHRMSSHFSNGHLPKECYDEVSKIEYIAMKSIVMMDIRELYYINLYKPKYNSDHIANEPSIIIKDFCTDEWVEYDKSEIKSLSRDNIIDKFSLSASGISSMFCRKRNKRYLVYIEYILSKDTSTGKYKKKQVLKGSFGNKEEADLYLDRLKGLYEFKM